MTVPPAQPKRRRGRVLVLLGSASTWTSNDTAPTSFTLSGATCS